MDCWVHLLPAVSVPFLFDASGRLVVLSVPVIRQTGSTERANVPVVLSLVCESFAVSIADIPSRNWTKEVPTISRLNMTCQRTSFVRPRSFGFISVER